MIVVTFIRDGQTLARLGVAYGQRVLTEGDCSWIDYGFSPVSTRLQRAVSFQEDAEEWARSLPNAYTGTGLFVEVREVRSPAPAVVPSPPAVSAAPLPPVFEGMPSPSTPGLARRWRKAPLLVRAAAIVGLVLLALFVGPKIVNAFNNPSSTSGAAVSPSSYVVAATPAKVGGPTALSLSQAQTLVATVVDLGTTDKTTVDCSSKTTLQIGKIPSCLATDYATELSVGKLVEAAFAQSEGDVGQGVCRAHLDKWRTFLPTLLAYLQDSVLDAQNHNLAALLILGLRAQNWAQQGESMEQQTSLLMCMPAGITAPSSGLIT